MVQGNEMLQEMIMLTFQIVVESRFLNRTLTARYRLPVIFIVMMLLNLIAGWININFHVAGTVPGNRFYYTLISFIGYLFLYHGPIVKIMFLSVFLNISSGIFGFLFIPLLYYRWYGNMPEWLLAFRIMGVIFTLLWGIFIEYTGKRFRHLRFALPVDYTVYLTVTMILSYLTAYAMQELSLVYYDGRLNLYATGVILAFAVIGSVMVVISISAVDRQVTRQMTKQKAELDQISFKNLEAEWIRIAGFRHDIRNHLLCMERLISQGKMKEAETYMSVLDQSVSQLDNRVHTGNDYADALLNAKYEQAQSAGIKVTFDMLLPPEGPVSQPELCSILSNVMDNAITGCMKDTRQEDRWITVRSFVRRQNLVIEVRNSTDAAGLPVSRPLPERLQDGHGFGLDNIRCILDQYGGILDISLQEGFTVRVLLPVDHS